MRSINFWHQQDSNSLFRGSFVCHLLVQVDMPILIMLRSILLTWNLTQSQHMKTESCDRFVINFPTNVGVNSNKAHSCLQLLLWNVFSC